MGPQTSGIPPFMPTTTVKYVPKASIALPGPSSRPLVPRALTTRSLDLLKLRNACFVRPIRSTLRQARVAAALVELSQHLSRVPLSVTAPAPIDLSPLLILLADV
jgi:hypothetical protein